MKKLLRFFSKKPAIINVKSSSYGIDLKAESNWVCGKESC